MKVLIHYLSRYKSLVLVSFLLASLNTGFSLCDPIVYGWLIDKVKTAMDINPRQIAEHDYLWMVMT